MKRSRDKDDFLKKPEYIGGNTAMKEFVAKNLRYPQEALAARIEGKVIVGYDVNDNGKIVNPHIINGIGYGCDEEAIRLVSLFRFSKVRNRKMRVKVSKRTSINFRLPKSRISYTVTSEKKPEDKGEKPGSGKEKPGYSYTINIKGN
jgi:protein TonB